MHFLEVLRDEIGFDELKKKVVNPLKGRKIGAFYGCMVLRPGKVLAFDDPENPQIIEDFIRALGADELCAYLRAKGAPAVSCDTAAEGVRRALEESGGETPVVACGSLYLMGEIREAVKSGR